MKQRLSASDRELYRRIDEVVHYIWDPVGICDHPQARREYRSYIKVLFGRVKSGKLEDVLDYMKEVTTDSLGIHYNEYHAARAAQVMLEWREYISEVPLRDS